MGLIDDLNSYWDIFREDDYNFCVSNDGSYTYGTTPFETFNQIIQSLKKPKRFIVLGSSIGWQCFYWNQLFPDIPTIGYDIHDVRVKFSKEMVKKNRLNNIEFYNKSMLDVDIKDGDLIWENNLCIDDSISDSVNWRALTRNIDIKIVSYSPILSRYRIDDDSLLLMDESGFKGFKFRRETLPTSWTESQIFFIID
jgi:hypothetical protein